MNSPLVIIDDNHAFRAEDILALHSVINDDDEFAVRVQLRGIQECYCVVFNDDDKDDDANEADADAAYNQAIKCWHSAIVGPHYQEMTPTPHDAA